MLRAVRDAPCSVFEATGQQASRRLVRSRRRGARRGVGLGQAWRRVACVGLARRQTGVGGPTPPRTPRTPRPAPPVCGQRPWGRPQTAAKNRLARAMLAPSRWLQPPSWTRILVVSSLSAASACPRVRASASKPGRRGHHATAGYAFALPSSQPPSRRRPPGTPSASRSITRSRDGMRVPSPECHREPVRTAIAGYPAEHQSHFRTVKISATPARLQ